MPGREMALSHLGTDKQCTAHAQSGERCKKATVRGGTVCSFHGGKQQKKRLEREREEQKIRNVLGIPLAVDPAQALLEQVHEAAGNVGFLRSMVQQLESEPIPPNTIADLLEVTVVGTKSVYGKDHLGDGAPHVLVKLYNEERDRLTKMAKMAIDAGIAERQVRLVERQGAMLVTVILAVLADTRLKLSDKQQIVGRQVAAERLRTIDVEVADGKAGG